MKISQILIRSAAVLTMSIPLTFSCQEQKVITPNTLPCPDSITTKTPEQILTGSAWKVEDLRYVQNNSYLYYIRGRGHNTANYDGEYTEFFSDNTGINHGWNSDNIPLTWSFIDPEKTTIRYVLQYPTPVTVTWENMLFTEKSIRYTESYTKEGINYLVAGIRTPK